MADELDALLERVDDEGLRAELRNHIVRLRRKRQFGLVFESHLPERVRLPDYPIRRGSKVVRKDALPKATPQEVLRVTSKTAALAADGEPEMVSRDELVVVAEFGEPIYPGLRRLGSINGGRDKPAHVVIKAENYHALEALRFSHAGKVDCIYIDPPYNNRSKDWKYNNDFVDKDDVLKHSKWLAMMHRRLVLSQQLLNPDGSLLMIDEVVQALDEAATKWVQERLEEFAVEIKNTTGATRNDYLRVQEQTVDPEPVDLILRDNVKAATRDGDGEPLLTFSGHIYADQNGEFPVMLNKWERTVVETEIKRPSFVAWYRNPARATAATLRIAYQTDAGDWTSLQPDFLVVSKRYDGSLGVSIIDPHGDHLADAKNKLKALARYAERFGDQFVRIESISEASDGALRSLDLKKESVREAVNASTGAEVGALYESAASLRFN